MTRKRRVEIDTSFEAIRFCLQIVESDDGSEGSVHQIKFTAPIEELQVEVVHKPFKDLNLWSAGFDDVRGWFNHFIIKFMCERKKRISLRRYMLFMLNK